MDENRVWINQELFYYYDKKYQTNSILNIQLSGFTSDYQNFSQPSLNLSITSLAENRGRRFIILDYSDLFELSDSFGNLFKNYSYCEQVFEYQNKSEIIKVMRMYNRKQLLFNFQRSTVTGENCVVIQIIHNESDFSRIIIPFVKFKSILALFKSFLKSYCVISQIYQQNLFNKMIADKLCGIETSITTLPSSIYEIGENSNNLVNYNHVDNYNYNLNQDNDNGHINAEDSTSSLSADFDKFVEENIDKIKIPEIESGKIEENNKPKEEIKSYFIENVLNNDIKNLESMITSIYLKDNPLESFMNIVKESPHVPDNFNMLPDIEYHEYKSICYLSRIMFIKTLTNYLEKSQPIPSSIPIVKYKPSTFDEYNVHFAFDLFMINNYMKALRTKLESKIDDASKNKSLISIAIRCFTDIFSISFVDFENIKVTLKSAILSRFKYYKEKGFFKEYDSLLEEYNLEEITEREMSVLADNILDSAVNKGVDIQYFHDELFKRGTVKLPYYNQLSLEQITKELIPNEINLSFGKEIKDDISEDVKNILFNTNQTKPASKKLLKKDTNIFRFVKSNKEDIPSNLEKEFLKHIEEMGKNNFDFDNEEFKVEEFGDLIVKALYVWNKSENKDEKYTDFFYNVENTPLTKDLIIEKIRTNIEVENDSEWDMNIEDDLF